MKIGIPWEIWKDNLKTLKETEETIWWTFLAHLRTGFSWCFYCCSHPNSFFHHHEQCSIFWKVCLIEDFYIGRKVSNGYVHTLARKNKKESSKFSINRAIFGDQNSLLDSMPDVFPNLSFTTSLVTSATYSEQGVTVPAVRESRDKRHSCCRHVLYLPISQNENEGDIPCP